ncbi:MAG: D-alanyl-D-alanine endopeptidase [Methylobacillus sp.]|nr:D-alanyl-D-alanine endopeptidase [Methylobacillus sp.]
MNTTLLFGLQEVEVFLRMLLTGIALAVSLSVPTALAAESDKKDSGKKHATTTKVKAEKTKAEKKTKTKAKPGAKAKPGVKTKTKPAAEKSKINVKIKKPGVKTHPRAYAKKINYAPPINAEKIGLDDFSGGELKLASAKALVMNQETGEVLYAKSADTPTPMASVTKLMTAMVVLDAKQSLDELVTIGAEDVDTLRGTRSRLPIGTTLTRGELLQLALMASENRAASALAHAYPGGYEKFIRAMNAKAKMLDMTHTRFLDGTGLNSGNVSTAEDLAKMVNAAYDYPEIRKVSTASAYAVDTGRRETEFHNTNILVRNSDWNIGLSKTGYINEAGRCLVMQAEVAGQPLIIVLLDSNGKFTRIGDANRVRKWLESNRLTGAKEG